MKIMARTITLALATLALVACGATPKGLGAKINRAPLSADQAAQHKTLVDEGNALWDQRDDPAKIREAIAKWDAAVKIKPDDAEAYAKLARACYLLADGHLAFDTTKVDEFLAMHEQGAAYAEQGMAAISPEFEKRRHAGTKIEYAVMVLNQDAVPHMYWFASNLGKWAKFKGMSTMLKHKDRIFSIVSRVYELDPNYFYGAADRYFGAYYAVAPAFAGGDLAKSNEYFQKALAKYQNYLGTHVLIAENYAPKAQDRALFERHLKFVLEAPEDIIPELAPEARVEKKKAEKLMKEADDKFE